MAMSNSTASCSQLAPAATAPAPLAPGCPVGAMAMDGCSCLLCAQGCKVLAYDCLVSFMNQPSSHLQGL